MAMNEGGPGDANDSGGEDDNANDLLE